MRKLSYKIGLGYFVLICINIIIAVYAIYHINQLSSPIDRILKEKYQNVSSAENMAQALQQQELIQFEMLENGYDSTLVINYHTYKNEFLNWHQKAIEGIALSTEPDILDSIQTCFNQYLTRSDSLHEMISNSVNYKNTKSFHTQFILSLVQQLDNYCTQLKEENEAAIRDADQKAEKVSGQANFLIMIFSIVAISISIIAAIYFTQKILKPVTQTTETVRKIGQGKLNQKVEIVSDDEIAELGLEFNKMTKRLAEYEKMNINKILMEKKKSEAIVDNIPVMIIVCDGKGNVSLANEYSREILNIKDRNWQNKKISDLINDKNLIRIFSSENTEYSSKEFDPGKSLITIKVENKDHYFLIRQVKILDDVNHLTGIVTLMQDVTSIKNLDRLKSQFMETISHEFKTPLTSMNMAIDILLQESRGKMNPGQKELLEDAKSDNHRLRNLTKELLDLSRLESGKFKLNFKKITCSELIQKSLDPLKIFINNKNIKIKTEIEKELPNFSGDQNQLSKALTNLVENAIQHSKLNSEVVLSAMVSNNFIRFCIADSGNGIPTESIDMIFDKFVQLENFQNADQGNIGLGLAITKEIIMAHNGKIWVESEVGQGSQFYFELPV